MDELKNQKKESKGYSVSSGIMLAKIKKKTWYEKYEKSTLIYLAILIILPLIAVTKFAYDFNNHNRSLEIIITDLRSGDEAGGYVKVNGKDDSPKTKMLIDLLKIYGFHPYLESNDEQYDPTVSVSSVSDINMDTMIKALQTIKVSNFHDGYADKILLYGTDGDAATDRAKKMLDDKSIVYQFVNLASEDPAKEGYMARLYVSGYDPEAVNKDAMLEYQGKLYPDPDLFTVIGNLKQQ